MNSQHQGVFLQPGNGSALTPHCSQDEWGSLYLQNVLRTWQDWVIKYFAKLYLTSAETCTSHLFCLFLTSVVSALNMKDDGS